MARAQEAGEERLECSLDLRRSTTCIDLHDTQWVWNGVPYPYPDRFRERTIYYWDGIEFRPAARYASSLIKLVPTAWGAPTFEIDGIKMLPSARVSPHEDAGRKVALIEPRGKFVIDTCGGLGYFAAWCVQGMVGHVRSYEKNPDVIWLRSINPWSPPESETLTLVPTDVTAAIAATPSRSADAVLHDPPRFGIAGELYSRQFYDHLARVLKRRGRLFHYTGMPNRLTSGRDVPAEVMKRLHAAGFDVERIGDGVLGVKK